MARRKGHKPNGRGVRPATVRGPYAKPEPAAPAPEQVAEVVEPEVVEVESAPVAPMTAPPTSRSARVLSLYGVSQVLRVDRAVVQK